MPTFMKDCRIFDEACQAGIDALEEIQNKVGYSVTLEHLWEDPCLIPPGSRPFVNTNINWLIRAIQVQTGYKYPKIKEDIYASNKPTSFANLTTQYENPFNGNSLLHDKPKEKAIETLSVQEIDKKIAELQELRKKAEENNPPFEIDDVIIVPMRVVRKEPGLMVVEFKGKRFIMYNEEIKAITDLENDADSKLWVDNNYVKTTQEYIVHVNARTGLNQIATDSNTPKIWNFVKALQATAIQQRKNIEKGR